MATAKQVREQFETVFDARINTKTVRIDGQSYDVGTFQQAQFLVRQVSERPMRGSYFQDFLSLCDQFEKAAKLPISSELRDTPKLSNAKRGTQFNLNFVMPRADDFNSRSFEKGYVESIFMALHKGECIQTFFRLPVMLYPDHLEYRYWMRAPDENGQKRNSVLKYNTEEMAFATNYALALTVLMRDQNDLLSDGLNYMIIPHPQGFFAGHLRPVSETENRMIVAPEVQEQNEALGQELDTGQLLQQGWQGQSKQGQAGFFAQFQYEDSHKVVCEIGTFIGKDKARPEELELREKLMKLYEDDLFRLGLSQLVTMQMVGRGYKHADTKNNSKVYRAMTLLKQHIESDEWRVVAERAKSSLENKHGRTHEGFVIEDDDLNDDEALEAYRQFLEQKNQFEKEIELKTKVAGSSISPLAFAIKNVIT